MHAFLGPRVGNYLINSVFYIILSYYVTPPHDRLVHGEFTIFRYTTQSVYFSKFNHGKVENDLDNTINSDDANRSGLGRIRNLIRNYISITV